MRLDQGDYLRVLTPVTSDGVNPVINGDRQQFREDHLPLKALKLLNEKNAKLPPHLRKRIEKVSSYSQPLVSSPQIETSVSTEISEPPKNKGGRPRKS